MKTIYQTPELEVLETAVDVITASGGATMGHRTEETQQDYEGSIVGWKDIWS